MNAWLIDCYRNADKIVCWLKTPDEDIRKEFDFHVSIYLELCDESIGILTSNKIRFIPVEKKTYDGKKRTVLEVAAPINGFERFVRDIERSSNHSIKMYNADVKPEQMFMYSNDLTPFSIVDIDTLKKINKDVPVWLSRSNIKVFFDDKTVSSIIIDGMIIKGEEKILLERFASVFKSKDPDVIILDNAFSVLPMLVSRLNENSVKINFHRWDDSQINYRGGKSFFSYGKVFFQDYSISLHGRFLVDSKSTVGRECDVEGIQELCQLTGALFQKVASRSFGASFQAALVRKLVELNMLIPYKEKPVDNPYSLADLAKCDRAGHTLDPKLGLHNDVAEIDFCSMYPWIIYNHNISAETIQSKEGPFTRVPGTKINVSMGKKGIVPLAIKPIIDRRMEYKKSGSSLAKSRAVGLKWVLVTCYGYLRFREFKLGLASCHMAICAYARHILLETVKLARAHGFEVIHGIVDSVYIKKKGITEKEVKEFCREVELITGIPVGFEGIFKWIIFLPSINDAKRPVPATYYGAFKNGSMKMRGIEVRKRGVPLIVKEFQHEILLMMSNLSSANDIINNFNMFCSILRRKIKSINISEKSLLEITIVASKEKYSNNIPQKIIIDKLKKKGINVRAGMSITYIHSSDGPVLVEEYAGEPDELKYAQLLVRSLFVLLLPFGITKRDIEERISNERQSRISEYIQEIPVLVYDKV